MVASEEIILLALIALTTACVCALYLKTSVSTKLPYSKAPLCAPYDEPALPDPKPLVDFDWKTAKIRDYIYANRVLRHPYNQTMAHKPMEIENWIEIDHEYQWYLDEKAKVIEKQGKVVLDSLPCNDEACGELLEVLIDYLPKRFPTMFTKLPTGIHNKVTNEIILHTQLLKGTDALRVVSRLVQDDFVMASEHEDGHVYVDGGLIAFPGFYFLSEKIGHHLEFAHEPVPYFNEKLLKSVERALKRFGSHQPFERCSWEIADDRNLFWHNIASLQDGGDGVLDPNLQAKDLYLRMDHQTFRKLPRTRTIIFGVHPVLVRIEDLKDSPLVPELLHEIHRSGDSKMMVYKQAPHYQKLLLPYLEELHKSQIERGLIKGDEAVADFRDLVKPGKD